MHTSYSLSKTKVEEHGTLKFMKLKKTKNKKIKVSHHSNGCLSYLSGLLIKRKLIYKTYLDLVRFKSFVSLR